MTEQCRPPEGADDVYSFIKPRVLHYTLNDYRIALGGEGPLAYQWDDKPHRLVYDLIASRMNADAELAAVREENARLREAATKLLESADLVEANRSTTYQARNGKTVHVQSEDGERVDLVHSDCTFGLAMAAIEMRAALNASAGEGLGEN
jgi:hypothetical protein